MIQTQSTATKRRNSVHKNLFDPSLYQIPEPPRGSYQHKKKDYSKESPSSNIFGQNFTEVKSRFLELFPGNIQEYLPEVDLRITITCFIWYVTSSMSSNLSKTILRTFNHPIALTELQFLVSGILCVWFASVVNFLRLPRWKHTTLSKVLNSFPEGILPEYLDGNFQNSILKKFLVPSKLVLITTFPMGVFQFIGHIMSHKAVSMIPVSLVHSMKALSPIITVGYYKLFKHRYYNSMTYYTLLLLILGVMITCWSTHGNKGTLDKKSGSSLVGLFFAFISMIIFVSQNIFAKSILTIRKKVGILPSSSTDDFAAKERQPRLDKPRYSPLQVDKITILFYCSCIGFLLTLLPFLTSELVHGGQVINDLNLKTVWLVLIHGIAHFFQAMLAFQLIGLLSSINYSVANIMKRIVIISVAIFWETKVNFTQIFGVILTIAGLYGYDKWGLSKKGGRRA
ncbi:sly41p [Saccharomyces arboricola H-6]|uniref:Sly41p n=1 Tax=Saccharomyces arboricola (strain H-6 / AS 2.3317 / CBS 10644) TaxID=1160507 RepID=J8LHX1_SACAR|nr:sly41p [Saccharomyces arboricola H-6]